MIPKKYNALALVGKKCRPVRNLENRDGQGITTDTVCTIISAHYGIKVRVGPCPHCGQYAVISHISREDLELLD